MLISLVNVNRKRFSGEETVIEEYEGLSSDLKPLLPANRNGSTFYEMDTQSLYKYNGETLGWLKQYIQGGSSGSSGGDEPSILYLDTSQQ